MLCQVIDPIIDNTSVFVLIYQAGGKRYFLPAGLKFEMSCLNLTVGDIKLFW